MKNSNSGFSIIEVMISVAIMAVMGLALVELITSQNKEVRGLQEKLVLLDLQTAVQRVISNSAFCRCFLNGNTFNAGTKTWASFPNSMSVSYEAGTCAPLGGQFFNVGSTLPLSHIRVESLGMQNINETITGSGNYVGELTLKFDPGTLVRSRKDMTTLVNFSVDAGGNVSNCAGSGTPTCRRVTNQGVGPYYISDARCDADEYVMSGGGRCEQPTSGLCSGTTRGFIHTNSIDPDRKGWTVDCFGTDINASGTITEACSEAFVICCK